MIVVQADYSFDATGKKINFSGGSLAGVLEIQQIKLITNVVDNIVIYQFNSNALGGVLAADILTLTFNTAAMSNADELMIIVDVASSGGLTDAELRATPVPVSGTIAVTGAGDATAANQATEIASLATIAAKDFATQTTLAALLAKVIAAPATEAKQDTLQTAINLLAKLTDTQPVSAASLPLPTDASTETTLAAIKAKTDNLDTALSGIKTGTDKIVAAPALDATLTGGSAKAINRGAAKGATAAGDITSTAASADRQPMDVILRDASGNTVSVGGGTQYTEDTASTGGEQLTLAGAIRQDTLSASQNADGDYSTLKTNAKGETYTKDTDVKSDTALLVTALNTLAATVNNANQEKISMDDLSMILKRFTQLLERPPYMTPVGEARVVGGSVALPVSGNVSVSGTVSVSSVTSVAQVTNIGAGATDQTFIYATAIRQLTNQIYNKIIS